MKIIKIKSNILQKALQQKEFPLLHRYLNGKYCKSGEYFLSPIHDYCEHCDLENALDFYMCNIMDESEKLLNFAKNTTGKKRIDFEVIEVFDCKK